MIYRPGKILNNNRDRSEIATFPQYIQLTSHKVRVYIRKSRSHTRILCGAPSDVKPILSIPVCRK